MDLHSKMDDWKDQTIWERLLNCKKMLYVHGLLSEAEWENVNKRLDKLYTKEQPHDKDPSETTATADHWKAKCKELQDKLDYKTNQVSVLLEINAEQLEVNKRQALQSRAGQEVDCKRCHGEGFIQIGSTEYDCCDCDKPQPSRADAVDGLFRQKIVKWHSQLDKNRCFKR